MSSITYAKRSRVEEEHEGYTTIMLRKLLVITRPTIVA